MAKPVEVTRDKVFRELSASNDDRAPSPGIRRIKRTVPGEAGETARSFDVYLPKRSGD